MFSTTPRRALGLVLLGWAAYTLGHWVGYDLGEGDGRRAEFLRSMESQNARAKKVGENFASGLSEGLRPR